MYCIIHKKDKRMDRMESNMEKIFISNIKINKERHLENIEIKLSDQEAKHLIITGKNGSGKTSLLNSILFWVQLQIRITRWMRCAILKMIKKI